MIWGKDISKAILTEDSFEYCWNKFIFYDMIYSIIPCKENAQSELQKRYVLETSKRSHQRQLSITYVDSEVPSCTSFASAPSCKLFVLRA